MKNKEFYELNAMYRLIECWDGYKPKFIKGESPDWFNEDCSIGIEVVNLMTKYEGFSNNLMSKYIGKNKSDIKEGEMSKFKGIIYEKNDKIKSMYHGLCNPINFDNIINEYTCKLNKLNKNYKIFNTNCIYMFYSSAFVGENISDIEDIYITIKNVNKDFVNKYIFDIVFIDTSDYIVIINNDNIEAIKVKNNYINDFSEIKDKLIQNGCYI